VEILLLVLAVVCWIFFRKQDLGEMRRKFAEQEEELSRLKEEVSALRRSGASGSTSEPQSSASAAAAVMPAAPPKPVSAVVSAPAPVVAAVVQPASAYPAAPPMPPRFVEAKVQEGSVPAPSFAAAKGVERASLEHRLGVNWLNRLGIVLLVFGVALYLAYRVTHFGPVGKVLTSFAVSAGLLGGGLWLERKERYRVFARAGIGGGWALGFFTTYAMYHVPATQVLQSQGLDLLLLLGVGAGMVLHSLRYRSQVVTGLAFLLAFSTVTISQVTLFSLLASAVLAVGLEVVCVREAWYLLEVAGVVAAYGNHFLWLDRTLGQYGGPGHSFPMWGGSTAVLVLFWAIFRVGYCVRRPVDETAEGVSGLVAVVNSIGILGLMKYQSFHPEWSFRALLTLGAVEMTLAFVMRGRRRPAFSVLVTIASVLLIAAIPLRFGGATWPLLWVLEGEALFLCGLWLKDRLMRWLGAGALLLVVGQLVAMHFDAVFGDRAPGVWKIATGFFCVAAAMWANGEWLGREDSAASAEQRADAGPFAAMLMIGSFAAAACAAIGIWILVPGWTLVLWWAFLALVLAEMGIRARSVGLRIQGYGVLLVGLVRLVAVNFTEIHTRGWGDVRLWAGAGMIAACVLLHERLRRSGESASADERTTVTWAAMWFASALVSGLLYMELPEKWLAAGWAGFALGIIGFALLRDGARVRSKALLLAVMAAVRGIVVNLGFDGVFGSAESGDWGRLAFFVAVGLLVLAIPIAFALRQRVFTAGARVGALGEMMRRPEQVFFFAAFAMLVVWVPVDFHQGTLTMVWSGLGVGIFLVALWIGERSFRLSGLGLLLFGVAKLLTMDVWGLPAAERYLLLIGVGVALLIVSFLYSRFGDRFKEYL
jgi:Predicted membrane protein (DUF2339)